MTEPIWKVGARRVACAGAVWVDEAGFAEAILRGVFMQGHELRPFAPVWDAQILAAAPGGCGTTNAVLHIRRLLGWLVSAELNA